MSSPLPPSPGAGPSSISGALDDLADRLGTSASTLVAGVVAALVLVGVVVVVTRDDAPPPELSIPYAGGAGGADGSAAPPGTATTSPTTAVEVVAHAAGAVANPGVYVLRADARVGDLLAAAGGPVEGADLDRVNLAAPIVDGSRVYVPRIDEAAAPGVLGPDVAASPAGGGTGDGGGDAPGLVDLNTADAAALEDLPGIGPATAAAIISHREDNGPFASVDDLLDVRGIGDAKLAALRDLVTV